MASDESPRERLAALARALKRERDQSPDDKPSARPAEGPKLDLSRATVSVAIPDPSRLAPSGVPEAKHIALADVLDSPFQPRKRPLARKDVADLMSSIAAAGQVTPIIVSPAGAGQEGKYHVHSGHRRCAALRYLGASTVVAVVRSSLDEREARKIAVADNIGREDLSAFEQAVAVRDYATAFGVTFEDAAKELGVQPRTGYRLKVILGASDELQTLLREQAIAAKPADLLVKIEAENPRRALRLGERYVEGQLTCADLEGELRKEAAKPPRAVTAAKDIELNADERVVTLKARLVRAAMNDAQRARLCAVLAQFLAQAGIESVSAAPAAKT